MPFVLLNDGSSVVLLNDGSSKVLLNDKQFGITIEGSQATQALYRRPELLVTVSYQFKLISKLIPKKLQVKIQSFVHLLKPDEQYLDRLRESFVIRISQYTLKVSKLKERLQEELKITEMIRVEKKRKLKELLLKKLKELMDD